VAPHTVNLQQVKTQLSRLLDLAHGAEEIIVKKAEKPCRIDARLIPLTHRPSPRRPGVLAGQINGEFFDPLPDSELEAWMGSNDKR